MAWSSCSPAVAWLLRVEVEDAARRLHRAMAGCDAALERIDKLQADADLLQNAVAASALRNGARRWIQPVDRHPIPRVSSAGT